MLSITVLLILSVAAVLVRADDQQQARWNHVSEVLQNVVLGPLHPDLRPAAFGQRNRTQLLEIQRNHFRAHLVQAMLQALEDHVEVCPWPPHITHDAVLGVLAELRNRTFDASWQATPHWRCPGYGGYVLVKVPAPTVV